MDKLKKRLIVTSVITILLVIYIIIGFRTELEVNAYTIFSSKIPDSFDGFSIVQLSDLHCKSFGEEQSDLIEAIKSCNPDIIVATGDFIDDDHDTIENVEILYRQIKDICPIYSVNGNHERDNNDFFVEQKKIMLDYGVIELNNEKTTLERDNDTIILAGIDHNSIYDMTAGKYDNEDTENYSILLFHSASLFDKTSTLGYDLIISGHTHGGIIRLPIVGGLINNDRALIAEYESGVYEKNGATLVSNRGLGDARIPRFYNNPEIINIILKSK